MGNKWTVYRLNLKLLSPMHIGWRKVGNLQQTRRYVTARTIWGALTARLAREAGAAKDKGLYQEMGKKVDNNLRFSYFHLVDQPEVELNCCDTSGLWPWQFKKNNNGGENLGLFDWKYLNCYAGSPINSQKVAEDGGLHETEYIMPFTREGKQVYLLGWVCERKGYEINNWKEALNRIQLGSERSYGWGRLACTNIEEDLTMFGAKLDLEYNEPVVVMPRNGYVTAHVSLSDIGPDKLENDFEGSIEMLTGRLTKEASKYGRAFDVLQPCWAPGTRVLTEKKFSLGPKGIYFEQSI